MNEQIFNEDRERIGIFLSNNNDFSMEFIEREHYWMGNLIVESRSFFFIIDYNYLYPLLPPNLYCYRDSSYKEMIVGKFWSGHQYSGGEICLFTYDSGESGWKDHFRLDEVLKVFRIMVNQILLGEISTDHKSISYNIRDYALDQLVYVDKEYWKELASKPAGSVTYYIIIDPNHIAIPLLSPIPIQLICAIIPNSFPFANNLTKKKAKCYFFLNRVYKKLKKSIADKNVFFKFCKENGIEFDKKISSQILILGHKDNPNIPGFVVYAQFNQLEWQISYAIISRKYSLTEAFFKRERDLSTCGYANLKNIRIIMVGLGSIGSKVAVELIRNGIKNITLYDPEYLEPENIVRGPFTVDLIGLPKVFAMNHILRKSSFDAKITPLFTSPLNPLTKQDFIRRLKRSDLLICTLDSEMVEYEINALCIENNIPAIFTVALDNAQFGRIFRVIPGKAPCYQCVTHYSSLYPDKYPSMTSSELVKNVYSQPGVPGINLDIWEIALKTTRFVFQTLSRSYELGEIFEDVEYHHFLVGNHQGWVFSRQYDTKPLYIPIWNNCPVCGEKKNEDIDLD